MSLTCSLPSTHLITSGNKIQTTVNHPCYQTIHSSPFTGNLSSRGVYFQLKYTTKTFTYAHTQPLTFKWLLSILSHLPLYTRSTKWRNNIRRHYGSVLLTVGFQSEKCLEFQNTTSFLQYMSILNRALSLIGLFYLLISVGLLHSATLSVSLPNTHIQAYILRHATFPSNPHPSSLWNTL